MAMVEETKKTHLHGVNAIVELDREERAIVLLLVRLVIRVDQSDLPHLRQVQSRQKLLHLLRLHGDRSIPERGK